MKILNKGGGFWNSPVRRPSNQLLDPLAHQCVVLSALVPREQFGGPVSGRKSLGKEKKESQVPSYRPKEGFHAPIHNRRRRGSALSDQPESRTEVHSLSLFLLTARERERTPMLQARESAGLIEYWRMQREMHRSETCKDAGVLLD